MRNNLNRVQNWAVNALGAFGILATMLALWLAL